MVKNDIVCGSISCITINNNMIKCFGVSIHSSSLDKWDYHILNFHNGTGFCFNIVPSVENPNIVIYDNVMAIVKPVNNLYISRTGFYIDEIEASDIGVDPDIFRESVCNCVVSGTGVKYSELIYGSYFTEGAGI
jgi:hypothetical protein